MDKIHAERLTLELIRHDLELNKIGYYISSEEAQQIFEGKFQKLYFVDRETGQTATFYLDNAAIV